jgi:hypothetical protein
LYNVVSIEVSIGVMIDYLTPSKLLISQTPLGNKTIRFNQYIVNKKIATKFRIGNVSMSILGIPIEVYAFQFIIEN